MQGSNFRGWQDGLERPLIGRTETALMGFSKYDTALYPHLPAKDLLLPACARLNLRDCVCLQKSYAQSIPYQLL